MPSPESRLVARIRREIKRAYPGCFIVKIHGGPFQRIGLPDLMGCIEGRFVGLEVKHPDTAHGLTQVQRVTLDQISKAGGLAACVSSVSEALDAIGEGLGGAG